MKMHLCVAAALLLPATAFADLIPSATADAFYVPKSDLTSGGVDSSGGKGWGVRGRVGLPIVFATGEYQQDKYDTVGPVTDAKLTIGRLGVGMNIGPTPLYGQVEYLHGKSESGGTSATDNGFGAHVGIDGTPTPIIDLYGQIGYVKLGDIGKGLDYNAGVVFSVMPLVGLFADYRHTDYKDDSGVKTTVGDVRVGVRIKI